MMQTQGKKQWLDEKKKIRYQLLDEEAQKEAQKWTYKKDNGETVGKLSTSQLRKYYGEVKHLERQMIVLEDGWETIFPLVKMLKAKVAYDSGRKDSKIPHEFKQCIEDCVNSISKDGEENFKAFLKHFEAVVGYYYGIAKVPS